MTRLMQSRTRRTHGEDVPRDEEGVGPPSGTAVVKEPVGRRRAERPLGRVVVHVLVPAFAGRLEREEHERVGEGVVVREARLGALPPRQAEHLEVEDAVDQEEAHPQRKDVEQCGQTRAASGPERQRARARTSSRETGTHTAVLKSWCSSSLRWTSLKMRATRNTF